MDNGRNFFSKGVVRHWNMLLGEVWRDVALGGRSLVVMSVVV